MLNQLALLLPLTLQAIIIIQHRLTVITDNGLQSIMVIRHAHKLSHSQTYLVHH